MEKHFENSVKVKFQLGTRSLPRLIIEPAKSSYENTGGLCGMWDNNRSTELYILDQDGVEEYLPNFNDVQLARDFWKYPIWVKSFYIVISFMFLLKA